MDTLMKFLEKDLLKGDLIQEVFNEKENYSQLKTYKENTLILLVKIVTLPIQNKTLDKKDQILALIFKSIWWVLQNKFLLLEPDTVLYILKLLLLLPDEQKTKFAQQIFHVNIQAFDLVLQRLELK